jgi:3-deoxy-manno-octulosonate cytidylyltransferase (CMP-KDO synthetase)
LNRFCRDVLIIIPSRFAASRFPGKPLAMITGGDEVRRPLIEHCWRAAAAMGIDADIVIATDDPRIFDVITRFGGNCVMTSAHMRNGTERCAEAAVSLNSPAGLIVNLQGDSPLAMRSHVTPLIDHWRSSGAEMSTPFILCDHAARSRMETDIAGGRPGGVFVRLNAAGQAVNFSRSLPPADTPLRLHLGIYAYTRAALAAYQAMPPSAEERAAGLEQLRLLDNGFPIDMVQVEAGAFGYMDVNYPGDIVGVEAMLQRTALAGLSPN